MRRERAWYDSLREAGLDTSHLIRTAWSAKGGFEAAGTMLADAIAEFLGLPTANTDYPTTLVVRSSCGCPDSS